MVKKPSFKDFFKNGYFIYKIKNKKDLNFLKKTIFLNSKSMLRQKIEMKNFFDNFHKLKIEKNNVNDYRMSLTKKINRNFFGAKIGYKIFSDIIDKIFGKDVVTQKNINLVIQCPGDTSQTTVHRDSPPNSLYEIVVWVPLTKTYKTKNMYILDKKQTSKIYKMVSGSIKKNKKINDIMENYYQFAFKKAKGFNLNFGEALVFWAPLVHCVETNQEKASRWSLNFRYKNTFSPYGTKGFIDYFNVANESIVTKLAIEKQSEKILS
jgi:sporadic carbohydrate cluster 2OG-Fe(II) oxygenase